ncbi:MAG: hypothetical protein KDD14_13975 [Saprospiraceae bacterium]|nr:hypothetical protein [Saprospiraceae bacterium]
MKNHHFLMAFSLLAIILISRTIQDTAAPMALLWLAFAVVVLPVWLVLLWKDYYRPNTHVSSNEKPVFRYLIYSYIVLIYFTWFLISYQSRSNCLGKTNQSECLFNLLCQTVWVPGFEIVLIIFILVFVYRNPAKKTITARESALEHTCRELLKTGEMAQAIQLLRQRAYQQQREQLQNDLVVLSASRVFTVKEYQNKKITKLVHDEYLAMLGDELMKLASRF